MPNIDETLLAGSGQERDIAERLRQEKMSGGNGESESEYGDEGESKTLREKVQAARQNLNLENHSFIKR